MDNQICPLHEATMIAKEGAYGTYHSHIIQNVGFCNGKKITPFKEKANGEPAVSVGLPNTPKAQTGNIDMLKCNAMNNAVNLAGQGVIGIDQIEAYFQKILETLTR